MKNSLIIPIPIPITIMIIGIDLLGTGHITHRDFTDFPATGTSAKNKRNMRDRAKKGRNMKAGIMKIEKYAAGR